MKKIKNYTLYGSSLPIDYYYELDPKSMGWVAEYSGGPTFGLRLEKNQDRL